MHFGWISDNGKKSVFRNPSNLGLILLGITGFFRTEPISINALPKRKKFNVRN
jgi:hypothetical protein